MRLLASLFAFLFFVPAATAHEFWIEPETYTVDPGDPIIAELRVGQDFKGAAQTYFPDRFARFDVKMGKPPVLSRAVSVTGPR